MSHRPDPRSLLTPAMRSLLQRIERAGHPPLHALSPDQARAAYLAGGTFLFSTPLPDMHRLVDLTTLGWPSSRASCASG